MNNCQAALVWLVSNRLKPVNRPIKKRTSLGPYLSKAQPPRILDRGKSNMETEKIAEVVARVKLNSLSMDLKKTPKEVLAPNRMAWITKKTLTTTQP